MSKLYDRLRAVAARPWLRWIAVPAVLAAVIGSVVGVGTLPPTVNLSAEPLYARGARAKPTLTLVLSVEFPTVGAQFLGASGSNQDDTYSPANEYLGYFDTASCYTYNDTPTETLPTGFAQADYKRFDRVGAADTDSAGNSLRTCNSGTSRSGGGFSGNFMNWASSSAIDILRRGLSGGDRIIDTAINGSGFTVLQRAVLPTGFWNSNNFPAKKLKAALAAGAVPPAMLVTTTGAAWTGDVYIANCLNRIHFGTTQTGNCSTPGANADLGVKVPPAGTIPSTGAWTGALPSGTTRVAGEGGTFTVYAGTTKQVFYGDASRTSWQIRTYTATTTDVAVGCNNTVFAPDPLVGIVKSCYTRDPPSSGSAGTGITADGFLYTRVRVCESNSAGLLDPRRDLCLQYPNGSFKPVGNLQKSSDKVRVAAFGYMNDSTGNPNERYGGVLREPMKYVGPKTFDSNFSLVSGANPNVEWNENTGELIANPDLAAEGRSGLINYLNQFGRSGPTPGVYKTYDPVSELYYEALRYLQGLPPTAEALPTASDYANRASTVATWKDGFPIYSTWTDPHPPVSGMTDYSCVKNNIVGIGDVNTHNDKSIPGNTRSGNDTTPTANIAANLPNVMDWTNVVGGFESKTSVSYTDSKGNPQTTLGPPGNPYTGYSELASLASKVTGADNASYYVSGLAYWANTHDIRGTNWTDTSSNPGVGTESDKQRPGMRVTTYFLDVNEFGGQTATATHQKNQFFLAAKYGGFTDKTNTGNPFAVVNSTGTGTTAGTAYWESPGGPQGETKNYFLSSSASAVLKALDDIFYAVTTQANSIAGGAVSSPQLTTTQDYLYQSQFDASDWSGDVIATPVSAAASGGAVSVSAAASAPWTSAAAVLATRTASSRNIYVGGGTSSLPAGNFLWASAPAYVKAALQLGGNGAAVTDATGAELRLNYLRGDRSQEAAGVFRKRGKLIGDIVNSGVVFSGAPSSDTQSGTYGTFYNDNKDRKKALFVGANDGMLHAFDAATGNELFGYIPTWVVPKLSALTSPSYVHQSYVDSTPTVATAKVGSAWKTVLVSGSGGGGQGVFALDVTNPDPSSGSSPFDASKVMWEFTDLDDADLGNVIGQPQILPFRVDASGTTKYFAVVASGVNNYAADGHGNTTGSAALFFLDLSKTTGGWTQNTNYFKIVFPAPASSTIPNGMANFTARLDASGVVSSIYAGDLQGKVWKLDFTKATGGPSSWTMDGLSGFSATTGNAALPFFIATDGASTPAPQPITMAPSLLFGPSGSIIVAFGTGKFLEVGDISGVYKTQSVYAVMDNGTSTLDVATSAIAGRGRLQAGSVSGGVVSVPDFSYGRPASDNASGSTRAGWYFDFVGSSLSGERQISNFAIVGKSLVFGSVIPSINSCDNGGGNLYTVDILTGDGTSQVSNVGITGPPLVIPVADSSLLLTPADATGKRIQSIRYQTFSRGSDGVKTITSTVVRQTVGRLSWREINNH